LLQTRAEKAPSEFFELCSYCFNLLFRKPNRLRSFPRPFLNSTAFLPSQRLRLAWFRELTKRARAEFLPVPALAMKTELSSPEAARVKYWLVPLIFVNAYFPPHMGVANKYVSDRRLPPTDSGLTRYGWNFSVIFYGIIPSNPPASLGNAPIKAESRNFWRNRRPKISVKNYMSRKIESASLYLCALVATQLNSNRLCSINR